MDMGREKIGKHITPISRKEVTKPLNQGGLGIRNLENQTKAWWVQILTLKKCDLGTCVSPRGSSLVNS